MYSINISENNIIIKDKYKLISSTTTIKNKKGESKKYTSYNCSFPYPFIEMFNFPSELYFYEHIDRVYITDEEPPSYYLYKKVLLQTRKNQDQKSSKENVHKKWAKMISVPKSVLGDVSLYKTLHYELHCNKRDFITNRMGLLEVYLSKRELDS